MEFATSLNIIAIISFAYILILCALIAQKNLKYSILLLSTSSILNCILYLIMDAPDVAMTEAALNCCLTTVIFFKVIQKFPKIEKDESIKFKLTSIIITISFGACLIYAGQDLASYGSGETPVLSNVQSYYDTNTQNEIGIPSFVAAILASYRGYDTLGETFVIFLAGLCVVMLIQGYKSHQKIKP